MRLFNTISLGLATAMAVSAGKIFHCKQKNSLALTFDDGPYEYTNELLDTLNKNGMKATFFINGENYWKDLKSSTSKQKVIKRAVKEGHQVASHTWAHNIPDTHAAIKADLTRVDDFIEKVAGVRPKYFRAPLGHCDDTCIQYIESLGYKIIQWDLDTNDWDYKNYKGLNEKQSKARRVEESIAILKKFYAKDEKNYLVLMHDVNDHTVRQIVPWIIKNTPKKYKFVTVAECLGDKDSAYNKKGLIKSYVPANNTVDGTNVAPVVATTTVPLSATVVTTPTATPGVNGNGNDVNINSGAMTNSYNVLALVTFLLYTLYMLF